MLHKNDIDPYVDRLVEVCSFLCAIVCAGPTGPGFIVLPSLGPIQDVMQAEQRVALQNSEHVHTQFFLLTVW